MIRANSLQEHHTETGLMKEHVSETNVTKHVLRTWIRNGDI